MRLVQAQESGAWALMADDGDELRLIAGGLAAWAPRVAGGEGVWALPLDGRRAVGWRAAFDTAAVFRRVLCAAGAPNAATGLAAVMGAPLAGRSNPLRSVAGYVLARTERGGDLRLGPVLVTRDEFGDVAPAMADGACGCCADVAEHLQHIDQIAGLRTGDIVLLGRTPISAALQARLTPESASRGELNPSRQ